MFEELFQELAALGCDAPEFEFSASGSVTLYGDEGLAVCADTDGDGAIDEVATVRYGGGATTFSWSGSGWGITPIGGDEAEVTGTTHSVESWGLRG